MHGAFKKRSQPPPHRTRNPAQLLTGAARPHSKAFRPCQGCQGPGHGHTSPGGLQRAVSLAHGGRPGSQGPCSSLSALSLPWLLH